MLQKPLPHYKRYPGDYARSIIASCSPATQGVWMRMEDAMHDSLRYGHLCEKGKAIHPLRIARKINMQVSEVTAALEEMEERGWLDDQVEARTGIIFSKNLLEQDKQRAGTKERKAASRKTQSQGTLNDFSNDFGGSREIGENASSSEAHADKSLKTVNNGHNADGPMSHPKSDHDHDSDSSSSFSRISPEEPHTRATPVNPLNPAPEAPEAPDDQSPFLRDEDIPPEMLLTPTQLAERETQRMMSLTPEVPDLENIVADIACASPTGVSLKWTRMSVHGRNNVLGAIFEAVKLEAKEQNIPWMVAGRGLLEITKAITDTVRQESGWEKYWPPGRLARVFQGTEYRNMALFERGKAVSNGNGRDNGGKRRGAGNDDVLREVLADLGQPRVSGGVRDNGAIPDSPARPAERTDEAVHRPPFATDAGAVHQGTGTGGAGGKVVSNAARTLGSVFPS